MRNQGVCIRWMIATLALFFLPGIWSADSIYVSVIDSVWAQETEAEKEPEPEKAEEKIAAPVKLPGPVPGVSPETFRMIEMIEKKNRDLKRREEDIKLKEQQLLTLQQQIQNDLKKIEDAIARSQEQIGIQKNLIKENVEALVKAYSSMKPQEAANLLEALNEDLAIQIISGMKSKVAGKVLSRLDVKVAKNISEKLAGQRKTTKKK